MSRPAVLVLGANGRFGRAAVNAFAAAGWRTLAQVRRAPAYRLPHGAQSIDLPLDEPTTLCERAAGATVVVYAVNPLYTRWDAELMTLFGQGLAVAESLRARLMFPGNVYNYGEDMPPLLREDTPAQPTTTKGRQREAMEEMLRERALRGLDSVVIRAGDFFGSGAGSWLDQVIAKDIRRGRIVYPGPCDLPHAWAYLPDLARAFVAVASRPAPGGFQRLNFAGHTLTGDDFVGALEQAASELGLAPTRGWQVKGFPWPLIRAGGLFVPMLRELSRMSYLWRVPHALDGTALTLVAGPLPATPIVAALRQSLVELGHAPARLAAADGSRPSPA
ncbi:MAG: NAD-dependent epimerase/dehydratase family protein [Betaproteobacteria bacterium]|nr:NAD-dependent epimerase/dehydratase family protein [Betaproteobacteria bacterium]